MKDLLAKQNTSNSIDTNLPKHIAIIMDGNRRWAKNKNIPGSLGHREGVKALKKITRYVNDLGIRYLTVYAFSTENWNRKKEEVDFLMFLIQEVLKNELEEIHQENVRLNVLGFYKEFPDPLPKELDSAMEKTKNNTGLNLQLALNYGSRRELTHAVKEIIKDVKSNKLNTDDITPELVSKYLLTSNYPDPDLLIRTGGEQRISNYLLWQCAYAEFYSTEVLWPEFTPQELDKAIEEFKRRQRRFGT